MTEGAARKLALIWDLAAAINVGSARWNNETLICGSGPGVCHQPHSHSETAPIRTACGMEGDRRMN
jgi:hypothetical protein